MRLLRPASALPVANVTAGVSLGGVALLTLLDRGATRAYATPWIWLFWWMHLLPLAALMLRGLHRGTPLALPGRGWLLLALAWLTTVLGSALASPHRGSAMLVALTPLAALGGFLLIHDWLRQDAARNPARLLRAVGWFGTAVITFSLVAWTTDVLAAGRPVTTWLVHRNPHPLGHSNYTAGLAVLFLPWLAVLAGQARGRARVGWLAATLLGVVMLVTSGSRGGWVALVVLTVAALFHARLGWKRLVLWLVPVLLGVLTLAIGHPRTRTLFFQPRLSAANLTISTVQRTAMLTAGTRMGLDRPLLGWGPGATPLVYPRYRAGLDGGVENALQLHSTPVQLWAELGVAGGACLLAFAALLARDVRQAARSPIRTAALLTLVGYGTLALTDFQLDVPIFALAVAGCAAVLARAPATEPRAWAGPLCGFAAAAVLLVVGFFGERARAPVLNSTALALARDRAHADAAIRLLRESLQLNPDQEIAHFNLGWLLVVSAPAEAERHFVSAARLVPDKGGVYFGLALARLNQPAGDRDPTVARALALECLNDPLFLTSPWWRELPFASLRAPMREQLRLFAEATQRRLTTDGDPRRRDAAYVVALAEWLDGVGPLAAVLAQSHTPERVRYFAARPSPPELATAAVRSYRRERTGYPVLMRNLDLPPPVDLYDVQENVLAADELAFLFPPKGWLPGPVLRELLEALLSARP